jgi:signal transduction histidine kinase
MTDSNAADDARVCVPLPAYADPALAFAVAPDGEVRIRAANDAFHALAPGTEETTHSPTDAPLAATLDAWLTDTDGQAVASALAADDPLPETIRFEAESGSRLPRRLGPTRTDTGHLLFVNLPDRLTKAPPVAPEALAQAVSHDLRNPLDVAKAHLRASMDIHPDDDHLETVLASHNRMEQIIDDVLTLARGERALEQTAGVDLTDVLSDAWESVATAGATLTVTTSLPTTTADRRRTERLFENLLRNSVEHGTAGDGGTADAGELTVEAGHLDEDHGFYLADDGVGIPPDERTAVFEAGYSGTDHGTGLGLAIVDRIARAHDWTVSLTESDAGGARVEIRFGEVERATE